MSQRPIVNLDNLGIHVIKNKWEGKVDSVIVALFRIDVLLEALKKARAEGNLQESGTYAALEEAICGTFEAGSIDDERGKCLGAWEVKTVAGPGYGDVLYAVAFGLSPSGLLTPDRMNVSESAVKVWRRLAAMGRERAPLESLSRGGPAACTTYKKLPDLNFAYRAVAGDKALANKLNFQGLAATARLKVAMGVSSRDLQDIITEVAWNFWDSRRPETFLLGSTDDGPRGSMSMKGMMRDAPRAKTPPAPPQTRSRSWFSGKAAPKRGRGRRGLAAGREPYVLDKTILEPNFHRSVDVGTVVAPNGRFESVFGEAFERNFIYLYAFRPQCDDPRTIFTVQAFGILEKGKARRSKTHTYWHVKVIGGSASDGAVFLDWLTEKTGGVLQKDDR